MSVRSLLVAALVVAVAAAFPLAASAAHKRHVHAHLGLVPLQKSQLGAAGTSLAIQYDSGPVPNSQSEIPSPVFGRLGGYLLDYGVSTSGGAGVTSIETQVEQFRTGAGATKALTFWKNEDRLQGALYQQIGIAVSTHFVKVPRVGGGRFAYLTAMQIPNADPIYGVDEAARSGSFILHATVTAGTESTAEKLAPALTAKLVHRLHQLLAGRLHGKLAHVPPLPQPGPPPGGPDLSTLVVGPSDLSGPSTVADQGYILDPALVSAYGIDMAPAGPFDELSQSVGWFANANEATWEGTLEADIVFNGGFVQSLTPVDLTGVGDNAQGAIFPGVDESGNPVSQGVVIMWQGQAFDIAILQSATTIQASSVQSLAQAMANHLNAGLSGVSNQAPTTRPAPGPSRSPSVRCGLPSWSSLLRAGIALQRQRPLPACGSTRPR